MQMSGNGLFGEHAAVSQKAAPIVKNKTFDPLYMGQSTVYSVS